MFKKLFHFSLGPISAAFISFFTAPIITSLVAPDDFGIAALFMTVTAFLFPIMLVGTDQAFMRFFYERDIDKRSSLLWSCLVVSLVVLFLFSFIFIIFRHYLSGALFGDQSKSINDGIVLLLCVDLLVQVINRYTILVVRMEQHGLYFSLLTFLSALLNSTIILLFCFFIEKSFLSILFGNILSNFIVSLLAIIFTRKIWFTKFTVSFNEIKTICLYSLPLTVAQLLAGFFHSADKYFLKEFSSFYELGIYTIAFKFVVILRILQSGFSVYWTPASFEHYSKDNTDTLFYERNFKVLFLVLILTSFFIVLSKDFIVLLFNERYAEAKYIVPFLLFSPLLYAVTDITSVGIYFKKKLIYETMIFLVLDLLSFLFAYLFIPKFGGRGCAMSLSLLYLVYFYLRTSISVKLYPMNFNLRMVSFYIGLLWVVCLINTFVRIFFIGLISSVIGIIIVFVLERKFIITICNELYLRFKNHIDNK